VPDADDLLAGLDPEQRQVACALRGPVCVIAGAGTGKTRAITHRIAYGVATGVYKPTEVLAVTFTTRAAGEMRTRLARLGAAGVQARTFHSAALRQARYFWPQAYDAEFPEIVSSKFGLVAEAAKRTGLPTDTALLRDLAAEVEWAKVSTVRPEDYERVAPQRSRQVADLEAGSVGAVLRAYEDVKRERGRIDMEDILLLTTAILSEDERIAAEVRRQYRWFVVDEYQDVNPLQATLLGLWLGGRDEICVVGDPRQTIYSFAGASPRILQSFTRSFPRAERVELVRNYRSTPEIVAAANAVFAPSGHDGVTLRSQAEAGSPVSYQGYPDESAEATATAGEIAALHRRGVEYKQMAVLFRINAQSEAFEEALGQLGVPFVLRGVEGFFQRAEVRQAVTLLRGAARAGEGAGDLVADVRAVLAAMNHADDPPSGGGAVRDRWESLHAIVTMAAELASERSDASLADLVADLDHRAQQAHAPTADGVTLSTLHAAKGLEWDAVFCVGMHEGMMPSVHADSPAAIEEERRLFYVGLTRARRELAISWSATRHRGGSGRRRPTRFLDALLPTSHESRRSGRQSRRRKAATGPVTYDEALFEALRAWRKQEASEQSVPAYVVFTDATLQTIAEVKPTAIAQLAQVRGVGEAKLDRYGEAVLGVVAEHVA